MCIMTFQRWIRHVLVMYCVCGSVLVSGWTEWENVVNAARCRVRCFSTLQENRELPLPKPKPANALTYCIENQECRECLKPCTQPYVNPAMCQRICDESSLPSCQASCDFLDSIYTTHAGTCPLIEEVILSEHGCGHECSLDNDCVQDFKCCDSVCGTTCHPPLDPHAGMPPVPLQPVIREKNKSGSIDIRWEMPSWAEDAPVLYIIEESYTVGQEREHGSTAHWQQIAQTTTKSRSLREIKPGHSYRFRVSAVNEHGCRGVSLPTEAYRLSREPNVPDAPRNLTEGDTIIKDGRIGVIVKWLPPKRSDLPVARYKVLWSRKNNAIDPQVLAEGEQRENVDGSRLQYEIPDLEPDTTYFVQIQALSQYGDAKLKSEKLSLYITTYPLPQSLTGIHDELDIHTLATPNPIEDLVVHPPFYQNGLLRVNVSWQFPPKEEIEMIPEPIPGEDFAPPPPHVERAMITWKPEACVTDVIEEGMSQTLTATTEETSFMIFDLRFDCHYEVRVKTLSQSGVTGPDVAYSFPTPSCHNVIVRGSMRPDCPSNTPRVPEPPVRLEQQIVISRRNNITAQLSWLPPPSHSLITAYRLQWGELLLEFGPGDGSEGDDPYNTNPIMDKDTIYYKVLSKDETSYSISELKEATKYMAKVQAISKGGEGRMAHVEFETPLLPSHFRPPYEQPRERGRDTVYKVRHQVTDGHLQPTPASMEEHTPSSSTSLHAPALHVCVMTASLALLYTSITSRTLRSHILPLICR